MVTAHHHVQIILVMVKISRHSRFEVNIPLRLVLALFLNFDDTTHEVHRVVRLLLPLLPAMCWAFKCSSSANIVLGILYHSLSGFHKPELIIGCLFEVQLVGLLRYYLILIFVCQRLWLSSAHLVWTYLAKVNVRHLVMVFKLLARQELLQS